MDSSASTIDDSISDTFRPPPMPLPFYDPRCSWMQRDRSPSHSHEESEPLRGMEMSPTMKCSGSNYELVSKLSCSKSSSLKSTLAEVPNRDTYVFPSYEDDDRDECPTCLEGKICSFLLCVFSSCEGSLLNKCPSAVLLESKCIFLRRSN